MLTVSIVRGGASAVEGRSVPRQPHARALAVDTVVAVAVVVVVGLARQRGGLLALSSPWSHNRFRQWKWNITVGRQNDALLTIERRIDHDLTCR